MQIGSQTVRDYIDQHGAAQPDAPFLIVPGGPTVTWSQLRDAARSFAAGVEAAGIAPGEPVGFLLKNSWASVLAILGTMYAGRVTAPVNLAAGDPQIAYVLNHSKTRIVLAGPEEMPRFDAIRDGLDREILAIPCDYARGPDWGAARAVGTASPLAEDPSDGNEAPGLLMYTSGTTGNPKGAVLAQRAPLNGGLNCVIAHELTPADRVHLVLPLYHINGFCVSLMSTLVLGASIVVPDRFSVSAFWGQVIEHGCTWFSAVPTQYQYLLRTAEADGPPPRDDLARVRFARSASAPLSPEVHKAFEELFGLVLIETMGLTECSAQISSNPMPPGTRKYGSPGKGYGNELAIFENGAEVPRGQTGEIAVKGPNCLSHYLDNPEATAAAFAGAWFLTGDLGHMDADGYIYVTGRRKELIIKGGENIAPREIDEALLMHPDVVEAAAFAVPDTDYGQRVSAAVKLTEGATITEATLIALARDQVGAFKAPDRVHILQDLPKGPSGKVQRLKLAELLS